MEGHDGTGAGDAQGNVEIRGDLAQLAPKPLAPLVHAVERLGRQYLREACQAGDHAQRVVVEGPGVADPIGSVRVEAIDKLGLAADRSDAEAPADIFAEGGDVRP